MSPFSHHPPQVNLLTPSSLCQRPHVILKSISSHLPSCVNVLMSSSRYFTRLTIHACLCHSLHVILAHFPLSTSCTVLLCVTCYCLHITSPSSVMSHHFIVLMSPSSPHLPQITLHTSSSPYPPHITFHTSSSPYPPHVTLPCHPSHITLHMSSSPYPPHVTLPCHPPDVTLLMSLSSQHPQMIRPVSSQHLLTCFLSVCTYCGTYAMY